MFNRKFLTREEVERHSLDMRQFVDFRQSTLPNGMRIIEAYNSSGLTFTLLPDRGMDIWTAHYKGVPLTWISKGSPHPADFGQSWLRQFNGGLLTTCGLMHVGPPEKDNVTGEQRDIHGRYSLLKAGEINVDRYWSGNDDYKLSLETEVSEAILFGEQLVLRRSYDLELGHPTITIRDIVTNRGDQSVPLMLLYHFNVGYPLVREGVHLHTANAGVFPRDLTAKVGHRHWQEYSAAVPQYAEQVFLHHLKAKSDGMTKVMLGNEELAVTLDWGSGSLPYFTQWKNTRQGVYVNGIEPGNCIPEGQNAARRNQRLMMLEPGQEFHSAIMVAVLEGKEAVQGCLDEISQLQDTGISVAGCQLTDFAAQE